ncbi:uncharacterized protein LOC114386020 [Glycine soja]|uniref:uncharacterized protein LOC114386020 n=1 Tax=Glycine soja TaxID=3848 RepID=UPI00103B994C|nr:uncharacterized protein LOC114386020 [Glycine soja]
MGRRYGVEENCMALLAKWSWDLFHKQEEPWAKILISKYGGWRALEEGIRGSEDSIWWRDLLSSQQQQQNQVVKTERNWKVGGGEKFRFWEDPWTHNAIPLMDKYPRLYRISDKQKQIIMNIGNNTNGGWEWKLSWRRALFYSEIQMADNFLGELSQQQIQPNREDRWSWKHDQSGYYLTKSGYDLIWEAQMGANHNLDFVDIWKLKIPSKSLVFAWRLIRDRLPTRMNLRRRKVVINEVQCPFCGDVEEEAAHLFFSCKKILPIWWESLSWVGVATVLPQNPRDHYLQHMADFTGGKQLTRWRSWLIAMTWTTWKHRNRIIFQNDTFDGSKLLDDALIVLWTWIRNMERDFGTHFNQWSSDLKEVFSK